ncbi:unnamed protein product [Allacma fusca]|uniref:Uncharacterized protein n=1 Tax=Allacma fusca TaxID=39272 RepID=A0A8J2J3F5_9HEXA|nr:unnamed protein product [Allacma fusca]
MKIELGKGVELADLGIMMMAWSMSQQLWVHQQNASLRLKILTMSSVVRSKGSVTHLFIYLVGGLIHFKYSSPGRYGHALLYSVLSLNYV